MFAIVLVSCAYFVQGGGMNENSRFALVRSLVDNHTVHIDRYDGSTEDRAQLAGHSYSDKAPGLALLAVVPYLVAAGYLQDHQSQEPTPASLHVVTVATCSLATAFAAVLLLQLLAGLGLSLRASLLAVFGWVFGTNAFGYATLFYAHQLVAALLVVVLVGLRKGDRRWTLGAGFAAGYAVISEYPAAVLVLGLAAYGVAALGVRRMVPFAIAAVIPAVILGLYNAACFGGPFHLGYQSLANAEFASGIDTGVLGFTAPKLAILGELLIFQYRGLLPLSPFLALAPFGMWVMLRDAEMRKLGILCTALVVGFIVLMSGYFYWDGGAAMGPRHLIPILPFAIIAVAVAIDRLPRLGVLVATALIAVSIAICTMSVAVGPEFPIIGYSSSPWADVDVPDHLHPISDLAVPLFVHGHLSQKADKFGRIRYSSEYRDHEDDAYNLGEAIGLRGLASMIPLMLAWLAAAVLLFRATTNDRTPRG